MQVERYKSDQKNEWNSFLRESKNGLFLFNRDYQDYHSDRFVDHSLMIYEDSKLVAIFPANIKENILYSHQGLTFGGVITSTDLKSPDFIKIFNSIYQYCLGQNIHKIVYKPIPLPFTRLPSQEDLYCLSLHNATLVRRELSSLLDLKNIPRPSELRRRMHKKAVSLGIQVIETDDPSDVFSLIVSALVRFNVKPTHTCEELKLLKSRFPTEIKFYNAVLNDETLAGIVVYDYGNTVHTQYLASSEAGKKQGALDLIIFHLMTVYADRKYLSFGISTENAGKFLNEGLILQKEGFGARGFVHDSYEMNITPI